VQALEPASVEPAQHYTYLSRLLQGIPDVPLCFDKRLPAPDVITISSVSSNVPGVQKSAVGEPFLLQFSTCGLIVASEGPPLKYGLLSD
jgi:hypothetical protein